MRLWIDDVRPAPRGYLWAKSVNDAKDFILMSEASMSGFAACEIIDIDHDAGDFANDGGDYYNGKLIARFYCDNVDMVYNYYLEEICELSCLTKDELLKYAGDKLDDLYAIHISNLEIFDRPKELSEFVHTTKERIFNGFRYDTINVVKHIEKAPQSYMYCEVEEWLH